jgi:hypothetical protein
VGNPVELGFGALVAVGGPWLFFRGFRALRIHYLIRNTPTARVRSMAMGIVEVNGAVTLYGRVLEPRLRVVGSAGARLKSNRHARWRTVRRASSGNPFYLRDESGVALVLTILVPFDISEGLGLGVRRCI